MKNIQIVGHTSFLGNTGYNSHSQEFFTRLNKLIPVRIRNYSYTNDLKSVSKDKLDMIIEQSWKDAPFKIGRPFIPTPNDLQVNIVLNESHHYFFYDQYTRPFIFYNVWESTRQLPEFFNRMLEADQFWCPTEFQRISTIEQGYPEDRVKIVHEGVDSNIFHPSNDVREKAKLYSKYKIPDNAFTYMVFGRWDYRKSTKETIQAWYNKFKDVDNCYLVLSVDNPFSSDGLQTTEERLAKMGIQHDRIVVLHFPKREEYIHWMQHGNCLLECSRSEGWGLPLMEALACGTPSICSDWGGHLEFADGIAYKVNVPKELPPKEVYLLGDKHDLGVWGEPDFDHLERVMFDVYKNYDNRKQETLTRSKYIRQLFTWENTALQAKSHIEELVTSKYHLVENNYITKPTVSFVTSFYNAEKYIDDLYPTILNQTLTDWEWIITDDFSTDNTKEKVIALCDKDVRIKYVNQKFKQEIYWNPHKYATGKYILTIDADDQIVPRCAEVVTSFLEQHAGVSCVHTNANYYYQDFKKENFRNSSFCRFDKYLSIFDKHPIYLENKSGYERVGFMFGAIRAYRNPGPDFDFNDGDYKLGKHEDLVKLLRLEELGAPLYLNRTLYKVRMREDSNSVSWGDNGGKTEFEKIYDVTSNRRKKYFKHEDYFDSVREELYAFLYSDLNDERDRKKVGCLGFNLNEEKQDLIKKVYFDHDLYFSSLPKDLDYIFVLVKKEDDLEEYYKVLDKFSNCKVLFFMVNNEWTPDFYKLEDGVDYFPLFNYSKKYFHGKVPFSFGSYLYKYCYIKFKTLEKKKVRLNLGCGNDIKKDYINIDRYNNTGLVDLKCDLAAIPFLDETVDEIYTSHVFEHIMINDVYNVLEEWERVLKLDGKIVMFLPNLEKEVKIWLEAPVDRKWFEVHRIFGSQSHEGNTHFSGHSPESLKYLLERFNFQVTKCETGNRGFGDEIQLEAKKIKSITSLPAVCTTHFVDGAFAEIKGDSNDKAFYIFDFLDPDNNSSVHQQMMGINTWTRPHRRWFTNWLISIKRNGKIIHEHKFDCRGKNVLISFDSKSLGDTIAWIPKAEEFRRKHNCILYVSTFWNQLFEKAYSSIKFVNPGSIVNNLYASYVIGCWEGNLFKNKVDWRTVPLQHVCSDILGLDHKEIVCNLGVPIGKRPIEEKYVAISEFSTFQCKFWNYTNGWQKTVDYLNSIGYKVISISKEKTKLQNVIAMNDKPIEETITNIAHCDFFIGLSAGPSWLAWALQRPVILISGYSAKWAEFENKCERVINEDVCHGCFNKENNNFQRGDWNWCPFRKGTDKQFECSKTITPEMVKKSIHRIISGTK